MRKRLMRTVIVPLYIIAVAIAQQQPRAWYDYPPVTFGPQTDVWQLSLFSGKQGYLRDEPIWVKLVARNNGGTSLQVGIEKSHWRSADFKIARIPGNEILRLRPYLNHLDRLQKNAGGIIGLQVRPGGLVNPPTVDLQQLFDLNPGTYTVIATYVLPSADPKKGSVRVDSNPITISVIAH